MLDVLEPATYGAGASATAGADTALESAGSDGRDTKAQSHEGTKKAGIKDSFDADFPCAFVALCLCVPLIHVHICENLY